MIGYHYTTLEHWEAIQKVGLKPSLVQKLEIEEELRRAKGPTQLFGVWIWKDEQKGLAHLGSVMRVLAVHNSPQVVVLAVNFNDEDIVRIGYKRLIIPHDGEIGNFHYHTHEEAFLLKDTIPPERITLVRSYNLLELVSWNGGMVDASALRADD